MTRKQWSVSFKFMFLQYSKLILPSFISEIAVRIWQFSTEMMIRRGSVNKLSIFIACTRPFQATIPFLVSQSGTKICVMNWNFVNHKNKALCGLNSDGPFYEHIGFVPRSAQSVDRPLQCDLRSADAADQHGWQNTETCLGALRGHGCARWENHHMLSESRLRQ